MKDYDKSVNMNLTGYAPLRSFNVETDLLISKYLQKMRSTGLFTRTAAFVPCVEDAINNNDNKHVFLILY